MKFSLHRTAVVAGLFIGAVTLVGCSQQTLDEAPEDSLSSEVADTANVEAPATIESLPPADPAPAPAMTEAAAAAPVTSGETGEYVVERGDTLMKIAFNLYGDVFKWQQLYNLNRADLKDANALSAGMKLKYERPSSVPSVEKNGEPYMIKKGDTLGTISTEVYGKSSYWRRLWENNKTLIRDPNRIYAGFYLYYQISEDEKATRDGLKPPKPMAKADSVMPTDSALPSSPETQGGGMDTLLNSEPSVPNTEQGLNSLVQPDKARVPASQ